jgi:UDP-GlcNAc3NAcA epimerase
MRSGCGVEANCKQHASKRFAELGRESILRRKMNVVSVVGARPQFIKAAAFSRELRRRHHEVLLHTGQHYDYTMSGIFFDGLEMPAPDVNLGVGSGTHGAQTGAMLSKIEEVLVSERPERVVVYGDTNSTLAGALAASKMHIPVVHVEAGLRSFNRRMPEEINRVVADHLSELLLCPSNTAVANLVTEGITRNVHLVGDIMLDVLNWAQERNLDRPSDILNRLELKERGYVLVTVHRSENTDDRLHLSRILSALSALDEQVIFPVHPRTKKAISLSDHEMGPHVRVIEPVGYLDMVNLTRSSRRVLTDSGGLQKEAYWLGVPCVTLRDETEWVETVEVGWNMLVGSHRDRIVEAVRTFAPPSARPSLYGDGSAAARCVDLMESLSRPVRFSLAADSMLHKDAIVERLFDSKEGKNNVG